MKAFTIVDIAGIGRRVKALDNSWRSYRYNRMYTKVNHFTAFKTRL
jgi:hypothetical protein